MAPIINFTRNLDSLEFLQPAQSAYAGELMCALAPAFRSVDCIAGLNLNYRKSFWVQYGTLL